MTEFSSSHSTATTNQKTHWIFMQEFECERSAQSRGVVQVERKDGKYILTLNGGYPIPSEGNTHVQKFEFKRGVGISTRRVRIQRSLSSPSYFIII